MGGELIIFNQHSFNFVHLEDILIWNNINKEGVSCVCFTETERKSLKLKAKLCWESWNPSRCCTFLQRPEKTTWVNPSLFFSSLDTRMKSELVWGQSRACRSQRLMLSKEAGWRRQPQSNTGWLRSPRKAVFDILPTRSKQSSELPSVHSVLILNRLHCTCGNLLFDPENVRKNSNTSSEKDKLCLRSKQAQMLKGTTKRQRAACQTPLCLSQRVRC